MNGLAIAREAKGESPRVVPFVMSLTGFSLRVCTVIGPFISYKYGGQSKLVSVPVCFFHLEDFRN